jgi:hypothetical protein
MRQQFVFQEIPVIWSLKFPLIACGPIRLLSNTAHHTQLKIGVQNDIHDLMKTSVYQKQQISDVGNNIPGKLSLMQNV